MLDSKLNHLIGFCGFKGSGKDTSADYLIQEYLYEKLSLAYPIKEACKGMFGFPDDHLWGPSSMREIQDDRYEFSGKDPTDGSPLTLVKVDLSRWWRRESDGEYFPKNVSPRLALQVLGTEYGRRLCEDIWVNACVNHVRASSNSRWSIPDVRFKNELAAIQASGGRVVRLLRGKRESNHPSELELESIPLDAFDFVIDNQGSKEDLFSHLDIIMSSVLLTVY